MHWLSFESWAHCTPAGFPSGMPGKGDESEGAMQHAPQPGRQIFKSCVSSFMIVSPSHSNLILSKQHTLLSNFFRRKGEKERRNGDGIQANLKFSPFRLSPPHFPSIRFALPDSNPHQPSTEQGTTVNSLFNLL
jgi:hypothetical protein